jgi:hypothetical protein
LGLEAAEFGEGPVLGALEALLVVGEAVELGVEVGVGERVGGAVVEAREEVADAAEVPGVGQDVGEDLFLEGAVGVQVGSEGGG